MRIEPVGNHKARGLHTADLGHTNTLSTAPPLKTHHRCQPRLRVLPPAMIRRTGVEPHRQLSENNENASDGRRLALPPIRAHIAGTEPAALSLARGTLQCVVDCLTKALRTGAQSLPGRGRHLHNRDRCCTDSTIRLALELQSRWHTMVRR